MVVKVTIQLTNLILAVKHNLCYWMSNKPRITSDFYSKNYNRLPNLSIIKESQIHIYVHLFIYAFVPPTCVTHGLVLIQIVFDLTPSESSRGI
jgi:hypothetical protein